MVDLAKKTAKAIAVPQDIFPLDKNGSLIQMQGSRVTTGRDGKAVVPPLKGNGVGVNNPVVTPDGAYIFTQGDSLGFSVKDGNVKYEASDDAHRSQTGSTVMGVTISPDSKLVGVTWASSQTGSYAAPLTTTIYPVDTFQKRDGILEEGSFDTFSTKNSKPLLAAGFDLKGGYIYTHDSSHALVVFTLHGAKRKEYTLEKPIQTYTVDHGKFADPRYTFESRPWQDGDPDGTAQQYLVHPDGNRIVLLTTAAVYILEVPKPK
jgi:hypothetical protein